MEKLTHSGTGTLWFALLLALSACGDGGSKKDVGPDASSPGHDADSLSGACEAASDCTLIGKGCCDSCYPAKSDVVAVPNGEVQAEREKQCPPPIPSCGGCEVKVYDPLAPYLRAGCEQQKCVVIDLREEDATTCKVDADCKVAAPGCCEPCTANPAQWIALNKTAQNPGAVSCETVSCDDCAAALLPLPFCADDGHCALRATPSVDFAPSTTCYSPDQNLEEAYKDGAQGCDCFEISAGVCIEDMTGRNVALICEEDGAWHAVEDGPCFPRAD